MSKKNRNHSAQFKFRVALETVKELKTVNQIASDYDVHPTLVRRWEKQLQEGGTSIFSHPISQKKQQKEQSSKESELYEQIGRLKMELEWLKKKVTEFS